MTRRTRSDHDTLSHLDRSGAARMVDVSAKRVTARRAVATATVRLSPETLRRITDGGLPKGDVFAIARIAGIQAAKRTAELIPLCHPLPIEAVTVDVTPAAPDRVLIRAETVVRARTGIEMEALTAVTVAALTIYDMCKAIDRGIVIGPVQLEEKSGGRSGQWKRL
ncbi:MAG: cyclic pyranopterin monophosphate synthase MoaC [Phycisphaerae bacterium]